MREQPSKSYSSFYSKRFCQLLQALSLLTVAYHSEVRFTGPQKLRRSPQGEDERCLTRPEDGAHWPGPFPAMRLWLASGMVDGVWPGGQAFLRPRRVHEAVWSVSSGAIHIVGRTSSWWVHAVPGSPHVIPAAHAACLVFCTARAVPSRRV